MNGLYARLGAAMPEREAAAAKRPDEAKAWKEAEEAERQTRLARAQNKGKRQRGARGQTNLLAVPDDGKTHSASSELIAAFDPPGPSVSSVESAFLVVR
jgi:hypothetical protein